MKTDEILSDVFDIEPIEATKGEIITVDNQVIDQEPKENKVDQDFENTRGNLYSLLQQGQDALLHALSVAKQSEHPRAFEVVGNLMKQLSDVNEQLLKLHERKQRLDAPKKDSEPEAQKQVTNNNAIFVGSTTELNKMLSNMNKGN